MRKVQLVGEGPAFGVGGNRQEVETILQERQYLLDQAQEKLKEAQEKCSHDCELQIMNTSFSVVQCPLCKRYFRGKEFHIDWPNGGKIVLN